MSTRPVAVAREALLVDPAFAYRQWALGVAACNQGLVALLDAQTALYKEMEKQAANCLQPWLQAVPPPSAQALIDAAQGLAPLGPAALQRAWAGWLQVWVGALRHDATEL